MFFRFQPVTMKLKMISDIWADGHGVVSLHIFHSVIPVEAFTREACMIEAMGKILSLIHRTGLVLSRA